MVILTFAWASSVSEISSMRADRLPADEHLVAGHQLAAGLEEQLVLVAVVVAEQQHRHENHRDDECGDPRDPRQEPARLSAIRSPALHSGTA